MTYAYPETDILGTGYIRFRVNKVYNYITYPLPRYTLQPNPNYNPKPKT